MKHTVKLFFTAVAALLLIVSCARKEPLPVDGVAGETRTLTVICEPGTDATRTGINEYTPVWRAGDALWVSDGTTSTRVVVPAEAAGKPNAELTISGVDLTKTLYFLYPYDENASVASGRIIATVPVIQDGLFENAHLAVGTCAPEDNAVALKNASAILHFYVNREDLWTLQLTNTSTGFTGSYKINPATGAKYSNNSVVRKLRMDFDSKTGDMYLSCMASNLPKGSRFTFISRDGRIGGISTSTANSLVNGTMYDLGNLDDRIEFDDQPAVTLGLEETANCYLIREPGSYRLPTVKGNGSTSVGDVAYGEIVWESINSATTAPSKFSMVEEIAYSQGYLYFRIPEGAPDGNALISACAEDGTVLWSWHLWLLADGFEDQTYGTGASNPYSGAVMMDRNLGALTTGDGASAYGLLYQYGRKDPFPGIGVLSGTTAAKTAGTATTTAAQSSANGTLEYATAHPTAVIYKSQGDWLLTPDATLWSAAAKTIYDPCPAGYHVPFENALSGMRPANTAWDDARKARTLTIDATQILFPAAGDRGSAGSLANGGTTGWYWFDKNTASGTNAWKFSSDTIGTAPKPQGQSCAFSVRCQKYVATGDEQILSLGVTATAGQVFLSPLMQGETYSTARIFWGDDSSESFGVNKAVQHPYQAAGNYVQLIRGYSLSGFKIPSLGDITSIDLSGF